LEEAHFPEHGVGWEAGYKSAYFARDRLIATAEAVPAAGDFGLMSDRVIEEIRKMPEHHRYIRGLRTWVGFR